MNKSFYSAHSTRLSAPATTIHSTYHRRAKPYKSSFVDRDLQVQHSLLGQDAYWLDNDAPEYSQFNTPPTHYHVMDYQSPLSVAASANAFDDTHALVFTEPEQILQSTATAAQRTTPAVMGSDPFLDEGAAAARWPSNPSTPTRVSRPIPQAHRLSSGSRYYYHESPRSSLLGLGDVRQDDDDSRSNMTAATTTSQKRPPPLARTTQRRSKMVTTNNLTYDLPPRSLDAPIIVNKRLTAPLASPTSPPASSASSSSASSAALSSPSSSQNHIDSSSSSSTATPSGAVRRRPSPFPLGPVQVPTPPSRPRRSRYDPAAPHIVDIAVETFNLPTTTLSTTHRRSIDSETSQATPVRRSVDLLDEDDNVINSHDVTVVNTARASPVRQHMQQGHLDKSAIHSALEEERERQWRRLDEERARSMEITWDVPAVTNEKPECKWVAKTKEKTKEKSDKKTKKTSWWRSCFGGGRAIEHDEEVVVPTSTTEEEEAMFAEVFGEEEVQEKAPIPTPKRRKTLKKRI